jgi:hypothetical protein
MITYQEVLTLTRQLPADQKLKLADTLLAEELGFGMWRDRADMTDVNAYVEQVRTQQMLKPDGARMTPAEFLRWVETEDSDDD